MQTNIDRGSSAGELANPPLPSRASGASTVSVLVLLIVVVLVTLVIWPT